MLSSKRCKIIYLRFIALIAVALFWTNAKPSAQLMTNSVPQHLCSERIRDYLTKLDKLLRVERQSVLPFNELNQLFFPLKDCDLEDLKIASSMSQFLKSINGFTQARAGFVFSNGDVEVGFSYVAAKRATELEYVRFKTVL